MAQVAQLHPKPQEQEIILPEGEYEAVYADHFTMYAFGKKPILIVNFSVIDSGFMGLKVPKYYNLKKINKNGFLAAKMGDLKRNMQLLADYRLPLSRIPVKQLMTNKEFKIETTTVKSDRHGNEMSHFDHYAKVLKWKLIK